jgi:McrBC 5-methylcytosine restriction system component
MTTLTRTVTVAASSSDARFWIKASSRGTRSGFAVLPDSVDGRVTVTVLPKPWSVRARAVREYAHTPGATTHVVMYETELATLSTTASSVGALAVSLADISRDQADLLGLGAPPDDPAPPMAISGDPFSDLIDLMLLAERGRLTTSPLTFEGSFAPSLLRLLTHERLLKVVESLIFRARPRYAERTETLEMVRGLLRERSLLFSMATGTPRVESTFDELTMDTPLLQVVASALRVVASERLPRKIAALRPSLRARAVHLLRYLSGVSLVDRERALLAAERLWLSPLDRIWEPAIDAAMPVLRDRAVVPEDGAEMSEAILVHVSTEKFWEQCLELALESAFKTVAVSRDAQPGEGISVPAPWAPRTPVGSEPTELETEAFPDFMFRAAHRAVVADAKYKLGGGSAPSSADGYQLFAYSHLATLSGHASDLSVILYPTRAGGRPRQLELERLRDRTYPLWLVRLPFPTRTDLQSQASWSAFVARMARAIRDFSTDWVVREEESSAVRAGEV